MKYLLSAIFLLSLAACIHKKMPEQVPANSSKVVVKLTDSLGMLTMCIPESYDTGFAWMDDGSCDRKLDMKYRFQHAGRIVFKETGTHYMGFPIDSVDQLTITYSLLDYKDATGDTTWQNWARFAHDRYGDPREDTTIIDTVFKVNDRQFFITGCHWYVARANRMVYELTALSAIKGNLLMFEFKVIQEKEDSITSDFFPKAYETIRSIRFSEPV